MPSLRTSRVLVQDQVELVRVRYGSGSGSEPLGYARALVASGVHAGWHRICFVEHCAKTRPPGGLVTRTEPRRCRVEASILGSPPVGTWISSSFGLQRELRAIPHRILHGTLIFGDRHGSVRPWSFGLAAHLAEELAQRNVVKRELVFEAPGVEELLGLEGGAPPDMPECHEQLAHDGDDSA